MATTTVGLISDTHGQLPDPAMKALQGCSLIVHAGDVGRQEVLDRLSSLAQVIAVRGNADTGELADSLPECEVIEVDGVRLYVIHELAHLDVDPVVARFTAVVSGHSHRPSIREERGVYYLNPGYAGRRRFSLPMSVIRLGVEGRLLQPRLVYLDQQPG